MPINSKLAASQGVLRAWVAFCLAATCLAPLVSMGMAAAKDLPPPAEGKVDYKKQIETLLSERCFKCHGPKKQEGGLRLDRRLDALGGGDHGPALTPGKSEDSLLIRYVAGLDEDQVMPPEGDRLTDEQVGLLRAWIDQGAAWE